MFYRKKNKGSMLMTAIFIVIVGSLLLSLFSSIIKTNSQNNISYVSETKLKMLSYSGIEYAISKLFPFKNDEYIKEGEKKWGALLNVGNNDKDSIVVYKNTNPKEICYLDEVKINARPQNVSEMNTEVKYIYIILSTSKCKVPIIGTEQDKYYFIEKTLKASVSDLRIGN
ncbi:MAG: hypothetical protein ACI4V7_12150 [Succinivibrionaceae bacterium]